MSYVFNVSRGFVGEHFEMHLESLISSCRFGCPDQYLLNLRINFEI